MAQASATEGRPGSLRDYAYEAIRDQIISGNLEPGTAISEADQAARLGVSRTPVREALQTLAREGLVEVFPKRGTLVARLTAREAREGMEFREAIEAACAALAAARRTPEQIEQMRQIVFEEGGDHYEKGVRFHHSVAVAADNAYLLDAFRTANGRITLANRIATSVSQDHGPGETHDAVLAAIEAGDAAAAELAMRRHIRHHYTRLIEQLVGPGATPLD